MTFLTKYEFFIIVVIYFIYLVNPVILADQTCPPQGCNNCSTCVNGYCVYPSGCNACCDNIECYDQYAAHCCKHGYGVSCPSYPYKRCCYGEEGKTSCYYLPTHVCCGDYRGKTCPHSFAYGDEDWIALKVCCKGTESTTCYDPNTENCCESYGRTTNGQTCPKYKQCCYNASTQTTTCCDPNECKSCVDGECKVCGGDPNKECCGGQCITKCDPNNCEVCDNNGHCVVCNGDPNKTCCYGNCCNNLDCMDCNETSKVCESRCALEGCEICDGQGNCVVCNDLGLVCCDEKTCYNPDTHKCCGDGTGKTCSIDETCCDGTCCPENKNCCNGTCCEGCQHCENGQCVRNCDITQCQYCSEGECKSICSKEACEHCEDGACVPNCTGCQRCESGKCVNICTHCQRCENNQCMPGCDTLQCEVCSGGECVSRCKPENCEHCDNGACVSDCTGCMHCQDGQCVDGCEDCETCTGDTCVSECIGCQHCVNDECVPGCDTAKCEVCQGEVCISDCTGCQKCQDGGCVDKCTTCQVCENGFCKDNCPGACQDCINGSCQDNDAYCSGCKSCQGGSCADDDSKCDECETCTDGVCISDCTGCTHCVNNECVEGCDAAKCQSCQGNECISDCLPCQECQGGSCVDICTDCQHCLEGKFCEDNCPGNCQDCIEGNCQDNDVYCKGCQRCISGNCEDDNSKCTGECETCINGNCVVCDGDGCKECIDGNCESKPNTCDICVNAGGTCSKTPGTYCMGDELTAGDITWPVDNYVVLPFEVIPLSATDGSDSDCYYFTSDDDCFACSESESDDVIITWSDNTGRAAGVAFPGGNTGTSVQWKAPGNPGDAQITAKWENVTGSYKYYEFKIGPPRTIHIATVVLESVTFGGTKKHDLSKKDSGQWNPANEDYATDYGTTVPNKAWVRSPALSDPICYTKGATGSQCTANVELSITPPLTHSANVTIRGNDGGVGYYCFEKSTLLYGSSDTSGAMNLTVYLVAVSYSDWPIDWTVGFNETDQFAVGTSTNPIYIVWDTPAGSKTTAKRIDWCVKLCDGYNTITGLAGRIAYGVKHYTLPGSDNPANRWEPLDKIKKHDCLAGSKLAEKALLLLGVGSSNVGTQVSNASDESTGNPNFPSDVTDIDYDPCSPYAQLWYTDNAEDPNWPWNNYEGSFKAKDGNIWKYWTWFPLTGPFIGSGGSDVEKDKSARYNILNNIRNSNGANFYQKYGGAGNKIPLP